MDGAMGRLGVAIDLEWLSGGTYCDTQSDFPKLLKLRFPTGWCGGVAVDFGYTY